MGSTQPDNTSSLGEFLILDDLITVRANDEEQVPILAYPRPGKGIADFECFTGRDLDRFIDHALKEYLRCGLAPVDNQVIALSGPSDLDYVVTLFSLSRLGYKTLMLSPRLAPPAIANLLKVTDCTSVIHPNLPTLISTISRAGGEVPDLKLVSMVVRSQFDQPEVPKELRFARSIDKHEERKKVAIICHSSGSTGLPKPISQTHNRFIATISEMRGTCEFSTFPLYHTWGNKVCFNTMWIRKTMYMHSTTAPMTADGLIEVLQKVKPSIFHAVPYAIKLLSERKEGVEAMARCLEVLFSGSQCPDSLGDYLTSRGLSASASNSDDPVPGSFHSKDIFTPHPTIPDAWKYLGRLDDRITLINGEKVLPTPIEGRVKVDPLVREAVVFGIEKAIPGILIIRSDAARDMSDAEYINAVWPSVQEANSSAEAFSQISKEMILPFPSGTEYPITDKGTIIRAQVYRKFAGEVEELYRRFENTEKGAMELEGQALEAYLMKIFTKELGLHIPSPEAEFFAAGMDSLQSIQARGLILRDLYMGGNAGRLGQNVVFESGNVSRLAKKLEAVRKGEEVEREDVLGAMRNAIAEESDFVAHVPGPGTFGKSIVVLTGATGSIGGHILAKLLARDDIAKVYCLTRGSSPDSRLKDSLINRGLGEVSSDPRIIALTSDLSSPSLGLDEPTFTSLKTSTTHIIHSAWPVNFNLGFPAFRKDILGLHHLLQLSLSVPLSQPARFIFCSSISVAIGSPRPATIEEDLVDISQCSPGGYGRSKWVAENIIYNAAVKYGADAHILRIRQIVGDAKFGIWNDTEAIPLIFRSALTLKVLPELDMTCSWLPVDTLAKVIMDLTFLPRTPELIYNIRSPHTFSWTRDLLPKLNSCGLEFKAVSPSVWLAQIRSAARLANADRNPAVKLLEYYERSYGESAPVGEISFRIERGLRDSEALRRAPVLLDEGYIGKFLSAWLKKWEV
ncbi:NRPS-like enzyme protein [Rutstroemia sp. NJR-2017a BBW]|nr:NRPS-like enzyme protein [Rutstroemia sp. NJR-2017a BBW]